MPRYDYECGTCHHRFELRQSFDSEPSAECPKCLNVSHRKFHSVPVMFKGSGWYVNDYGKRSSSSDSSDSKDTSEAKPKAESKSESSSESKSDTKSDSSSKEPSKASSASTKRDGN